MLHIRQTHSSIISVHTHGSSRHGGCLGKTMVGSGIPPDRDFSKDSGVATPVEMEDRFENIERRLDRIEQILPTLATKDDLKAFATKDDLKAFATKEDLAHAFERAELNARMLHEDLVEKIKLLGENRRKQR
jgi:hypothetical protein